MAKSALKFKDSVAQYERIAAEVAARRFSGIYLLMGEESYFIDALSDQLGSSTRPRGPSTRSPSTGATPRRGR
jgi:DNA polymerase-3 subunit delta